MKNFKKIFATYKKSNHGKSDQMKVKYIFTFHQMSEMLGNANTLCW